MFALRGDTQTIPWVELAEPFPFLVSLVKSLVQGELKIRKARLDVKKKQPGAVRPQF